jgi:WhiB family redox-sensing transcriptional regulator
MIEFPCQTDPELFFPAAEEGTDAFDRQAARAVALCEGCPFREDCLDNALAFGEDAGIWGGTTPEQRRAMRRMSLVIA